MSAGRPRLSRGDRILAGLVGFVGPILIRLLGCTWRVTTSGEQVIDAVHAGGRAAIFAFWHGQFLPLEYVYRGRGIHVLSSWHRDGELSARLMAALGFGVVRGSTSRGSARGLLGMLSKVKEGRDLAITPDGPRGPSERVQRGILFLAEKSGCPIVPIGVAARPSKRLTSWDRFIVPYPFSRIAVVFGEPVSIDGSVPIAESARTLGAELGRLTETAEALVGAAGGGESSGARAGRGGP